MNSRPAYRDAAAQWEGAVAVVMTQGGTPAARKAVFLDLWHGECRAARVANDEDLEAARYVLTGTAPAWRDVLTGRLAPLMAIMGGKIRLTKGSLAALVPLAPAAKELVAAALEMEITFPPGW